MIQERLNQWKWYDMNYKILMMLIVVSFGLISSYSVDIHCENIKGRDIYGADIQLMKGDEVLFNGTTDVNGELLFDNVNAGQYFIMFSKSNYPYRIKSVLINDDLDIKFIVTDTDIPIIYGRIYSDDDLVGKEIKLVDGVLVKGNSKIFSEGYFLISTIYPGEYNFYLNSGLNYSFGNVNLSMFDPVYTELYHGDDFESVSDVVVSVTVPTEVTIGEPIIMLVMEDGVPLNDVKVNVTSPNLNNYILVTNNEGEIKINSNLTGLYNFNYKNKNYLVLVNSNVSAVEPDLIINDTNEFESNVSGTSPSENNGDSLIAIILIVGGLVIFILIIMVFLFIIGKKKYKIKSKI